MYSKKDNAAEVIATEYIRRNALFQKNSTIAKGEYYIVEDGRAIIRGLNSPDIST